MRLESWLKMSFIISWQTQSGTISGAENVFSTGTHLTLETMMQPKGGAIPSIFSWYQKEWGDEKWGIWPPVGRWRLRGAGEGFVSA